MTLIHCFAGKTCKIYLGEKQINCVAFSLDDKLIIAADGGQGHVGDFKFYFFRSLALLLSRFLALSLFGSLALSPTCSSPSRWATSSLSLLTGLRMT